MTIPVAVVPIAPFGNAAEFVAVAVCDTEVAISDLVSAEAPTATAGLDPPTIVYAKFTIVATRQTLGVAAVIASMLETLRIAAFSAIRLEVGEALLFPSPFGSLNLPVAAAATLEMFSLALATSSAFHALGLAVAAATALDTLSVLTAATATAFGLLTASAAALGLGMAATLSTALVGLR